MLHCKKMTFCPFFFLLLLLFSFAHDFVVRRHAEVVPAHGFPPLYPGVHIHVFLKKKQNKQTLNYCSHSRRTMEQLQRPCLAFLCLLQSRKKGTHLLCVSSPHAKTLHFPVLPNTADVVHLLKDSLSSAGTNTNRA